MPSNFETNFETYVMPAAERAFGVDVTLSDGETTTDTFTALRQELIHEVAATEFGLPQKVTIREYEFAAADVTDIGTPQEGQRITEGATVWQILPVDDNKQAVALLEGGYRYRVQTMQVT